MTNGKEPEVSDGVPLELYTNEFPLSTNTIGALLDPKNPDAYRELGGLRGIAQALRTDPAHGLPQELNDIENHRVAKYGRNELPPMPMVTIPELVWEALHDQVLILLICAAVIATILGALPWTSHDPKTGWIDGVAILIAVVIVVTVTSTNDYQKQKQFAKLDNKKAEKEVKVIRGGEQLTIPIAEVRAGDVVLLFTGDNVCADGVFIDGHSIKCDESSLTGESDLIKKGHLEDHLDPFLMSGSQVLEGTGRMLVIAVGINSFGGRTLMATRVPDEETPLQQKLEVLASTIGKFGMGAAVLLLITAIPKYFIEHKIHDTLDNERIATDMVRLVIESITIVVVAVPEGLPLAVTMALAYGMIKMLKDNNLVRHLAACETMGGATNICSDKTGTLTQNVMTVVTGMIAGKCFDTIGENTKQQLAPDVLHLLCDGIAVNSSCYEAMNKKGKMEFIGNKTESALLILSRQLGIEYLPIRNQLAVFQQYPFSSQRKRMSTVVKLSDQPHYRVFTKGASEIVLDMCTTVLIQDENGNLQVVPLTPQRKEEYNRLITTYATDALRTIGLAYSDIRQERDWQNTPEDNLTLISIVGIRDPLREEVPDAVAQCQRAGITVRMVTGDNIITAENIARKAGILRAGGICMEGPKFRALPKEEIKRIIPNLHVLARSSPTDKQLLVGTLKEMGEVVAVTGDGTNDGPALKMANIGFSMGIAGTDVAIAASGIVLQDDNFASIVKAVLWGRNIFDAIRKFLQFQLTVNVVAVTVAFIGTLTGDGESPLTAVQLLWVNLIMDTFAALALATEPPTPDLLERKPLGRKASLITRRMWRFIIMHSIYQLTVALTLLYASADWFGVPKNGRIHFTIIFNTFVFMQIFNELNSRKLDNELNMFKGILNNTIFVLVLLGTIAVQVLFVEVGGEFAKTTGLTWAQWLICVALGIGELPVGILLRFIPIDNIELQNSPLTEEELKEEEEKNRKAMGAKDGEHTTIVVQPATQPVDQHPKAAGAAPIPSAYGEPNDGPHRAEGGLAIPDVPSYDTAHHRVEPDQHAPLLVEKRNGWDVVRNTQRMITVVNAFKQAGTFKNSEEDFVGKVRGHHRL